MSDWQQFFDQAKYVTPGKIGGITGNGKDFWEDLYQAFKSRFREEEQYRMMKNAHHDQTE